VVRRSRDPARGPRPENGSMDPLPATLRSIRTGFAYNASIGAIRACSPPTWWAQRTSCNERRPPRRRFRPSAGQARPVSGLRRAVRSSSRRLCPGFGQIRRAGRRTSSCRAPSAHEVGTASRDIPVRSDLYSYPGGSDEARQIAGARRARGVGARRARGGARGCARPPRPPGRARPAVRLRPAYRAQGKPR
jgi:hypothetical protein